MLCLFVHGCLISWKQRNIKYFHSYTEAEYQVVAAAVKNQMDHSVNSWSRHQSEQTGYVLLWDSKDAIHIVVNPVFHEQTKHIERVVIVFDAVRDCLISAQNVRSKDKIADNLTKVLNSYCSSWVFKISNFFFC